MYSAESTSVGFIDTEAREEIYILTACYGLEGKTGSWEMTAFQKVMEAWIKSIAAGM